MKWRNEEWQEGKWWVGNASSRVVREGLLQVSFLLTPRRDMQSGTRHELSHRKAWRWPGPWCLGVKPGQKSGQAMYEPVCEGICLSKYHQRKQEKTGWGQFKRTFCNRLLLFPLVFIRLSYLTCNGFHPVAFIPQGSNNIQLPPFSPHDSFLLLTGCNCFVTSGLK